MTVYVGMNISYTEGCCGVKQLADFSETYSRPAEYRSIHAEGRDNKEAYQNLFEKLQAFNFSEYVDDDDENEYSCAVVQIWFYRTKNYDDSFTEPYRAHELMELVAAIPGVVELGEYNNPNSGNNIKGYQWAVH